MHGISVNVTEVGRQSNQTILFPAWLSQNLKAFEAVMANLKDNYHLLAIDLPGIGKSDPIKSSDKYSIAKFINGFSQSLHLKQIVLVGHDIGGMIAYSFLKKFPENLSKVVIMNTAIPGVKPWGDVKQNPYIYGIFPFTPFHLYLKL